MQRGATVELAGSAASKRRVKLGWPTLAVCARVGALFFFLLPLSAPAVPLQPSRRRKPQSGKCHPKTQVPTPNLGHPPCPSTSAGIVEVLSSPRAPCQPTPPPLTRATRQLDCPTTEGNKVQMPFAVVALQPSRHRKPQSEKCHPKTQVPTPNLGHPPSRS